MVDQLLTFKLWILSEINPLGGGCEKLKLVASSLGKLYVVRK